MKDLYFAAAFMILALGTCWMDGYLEAKEGIQAARWRAHKVYVNQENGELVYVAR